MAGKVKFYRGAQGTSLPTSTQDGAIFIIERLGSDGKGYGVGDIYVDMDQGKRLHIIPDKEIITYTSNMQSIPSKLGQTYLFQETNIGKVGIAVGDGTTLIGDLKVYEYEIITNAIKNKVNAYLGTEYYSLNNIESDIGNKTEKSLAFSFTHEYDEENNI